MKYRAVIDLYEMEPYDRGYVMEAFEQLGWIEFNGMYFDMYLDEIEDPRLAEILGRYAEGNETFILLYSW